MSTTERRKIGKYEVLSLLGKGGMGVVYQARDPHIDRLVAIKTINIVSDEPELMNRLRMEARSAGRLDHPNIVTIYDFGEEKDIAYIVMEYVEGENLARTIDTQRPLNLGQKLDIIGQICRGLAYAHELSVVHRDIKPANVCVTPKGVAKILDFGLARADSTRVTRTGYMSGTVAYMSPERLRGTSGPAADIFAVGVVAYELLTYRRAFPGNEAPDVMVKILSGQNPLPPSEMGDVPPELDPIVMKALASDPADRYPTAAAFAEAISEFRASNAFRDFISDQRRTDELERQRATYVERPSASLNPYSAPTGGRDQGQQPTLRMGQPDRSTIPGSVDTQAPTAHSAPTVHSALTMRDEPAAGPTTVAAVTGPTPARRRSSFTPLMVIAALLVVLIGVLVLSPKLSRTRSDRDVTTSTQPQTQTTPSAPQITPTQAAEFELQEAVAASLAKEIAALQLTTEERLKLMEARTTADLAHKRFRENDWSTSAKLMSTAITSMREILIKNQGVSTESVARARSRAQSEWDKIRSGASQLTSRARREGVVLPETTLVEQRLQHLRAYIDQGQNELIRSEGRALLNEYERSLQKAIAERKAVVVEKPPEVPDTTTIIQPAPAPAPPPPAAPQPAEPTAEQLRSEVTAFVRRIAAAYQGRDLEFFRRNSLRYSEEMGRAIRNSPSVRVEFEILSINLTSPTTASVGIRRTDTFDRNTPPAVQDLVYTLRRNGEGDWKIVEFRRR